MTMFPSFLVEGSGNRFIAVVDPCSAFEESLVVDAESFSRNLLSRCSGVVDSLLYLSPSIDADFGMRVLEKDGSESLMCGNGLRAAALLLAELSGNPMPLSYVVATKSGRKTATVIGPSAVAVSMGPCTVGRTVSIAGRTFHIGDVGEPHACAFVDMDDREFRRWGALLTSENSPLGPINLNVVRRKGDGIAVRTFERGVRDETLSCGTGSVVSAAAARLLFPELPSVVDVSTAGGVLSVDVERSVLRGSAKVLGRVPLSLLPSSVCAS